MSEKRWYYTIGELAAAAGVPTSTVRYYERIALLRSQGRTGSNYRYYGSAGLQRLRFICDGQAAGLSLDDLATMLKLSAGDAGVPCREVQQLLGARLKDVEQRINGLVNVEKALRRALRTCRTSERAGLCGVIDNLRNAGDCP